MRIPALRHSPVGEGQGFLNALLTTDPRLCKKRHGGGWQAGSRASYKYWGPFLARNGYALFSIDYRLRKAGTYPGSVYDVKAAVQFVRARAADLGLDPERIGLMGDSAGAISPPSSGSRPTSSRRSAAATPIMRCPPT